MKRCVVLLTMVLTLASGAFASMPAKKGSFLKRVAIGLYKSPEATLYGIVNVVGAGVDTVERIVAGVHTAVSKVDDFLDRAETALNPAGNSGTTQAPAAAPPGN